MMKVRIVTVIAGLLLITACGDKNKAVYLPTKATVKLASAGTGTIYGIDMTINLPAGVRVGSSNPPQTDAGVVSASGAAEPGSIAAGVYSAATGTFPATVRILIANGNGFAPGEFCTVNCRLVPDAWPREADFSIERFSASDENGDAINGLTAGLKADIR